MAQATEMLLDVIAASDGSAGIGNQEPASDTGPERHPPELQVRRER
jgi:hypothetical protein